MAIFSSDLLSLTSLTSLKAPLPKIISAPSSFFTKSKSLIERCWIKVPFPSFVDEQSFLCFDLKNK